MIEKKSSFPKTVVVATAKWCKSGWNFNKKVIKAFLLMIERKVTGERPVFTQEFQLIDPEDWGASVSAERSACSLKACVIIAYSFIQELMNK